MNLIELLTKKHIGGFTTQELRDIFTASEDAITKIRIASNGAIVMQDKRILKCVAHYYKNSENDMKKSSLLNDCHQVHRIFDIQGISNNHCARCHLNCLSKFGNGALQLK